MGGIYRGLGALGGRRPCHISLNAGEFFALGVHIGVDVALQRVQPAKLGVNVLVLRRRGDLNVVDGDLVFARGLLSGVSRCRLAVRSAVAGLAATVALTTAITVTTAIAVTTTVSTRASESRSGH
ncbi:hypothetical protein X771_30560 [Mesorhizobium sp. LSJC277A00]|nr:hypothetical protein [Mesorhizobium sp. LSJC277A00]ESW63242.1 hypothetical protein X771_30560 [Mesorhizobium sp. LSJC277A00]